MSTSSLSRALGAFACVLSLAVPTVARADVVADLRVLTPGAALEPGANYVTGTESIKTDPHARCFLGGAGGSGQRVRIQGPTALGVAKSALRWNQALAPISVTDEFGFGLGVCGFGGKRGNQNRYWSLSVNYADPGAGGDQVRLHSGDSVLWYLTSYPPPPLLELTAPAAATPGLVQVHVDQHECTTGPAPDYEVTCGASPAQGATVTGGDAPALTDSEGNAAVPIASQGHFALQAGLDADVPSESVDVCVNDDVSKCPDSHGKVIYGRPRADRFGGTPGWDVIRSGGGDDVISIRSGGRDRVDCGAGSDRVIVGSGDGDDRIGSSCERVVKR